ISTIIFWVSIPGHRRDEQAVLIGPSDPDRIFRADDDLPRLGLIARRLDGNGSDNADADLRHVNGRAATSTITSSDRTTRTNKPSPPLPLPAELPAAPEPPPLTASPLGPERDPGVPPWLAVPFAPPLLVPPPPPQTSKFGSVQSSTMPGPPSPGTPSDASPPSPPMPPPPPEALIGPDDPACALPPRPPTVPEPPVELSLFVPPPPPQPPPPPCVTGPPYPPPGATNHDVLLSRISDGEPL